MKNKTKDPSRIVVAHHEAAHAVMACRLLRGVKYVELHPDPEKMGSYGTVHVLGKYQHFRKSGPSPWNDPKRSEHAFRSCIMSYAGPVAHSRIARCRFQKLMFGHGMQDRQDILLAVSHVRKGVGFLHQGGFATMLFGPPPAMVTGEALDFAEAALRRSRKLVTADWTVIEAVAHKLAKRGRLEGDDVLLRKIERTREKLL